MKPVSIDFSGKKATPLWWGICLFIVGAALCIGATWRLNTLDIRYSKVSADVERARQSLAARQPKPKPVLQLSEGQIVSINAAVSNLNLPWQALFSSIERTKPANVALLGLEPNSSKKLLRIFAESKQAEDMLEFVRLVRQQPEFSDAVLVKHEIYMQDPNRPYRFSVEATWKDTI